MVESPAYREGRGEVRADHHDVNPAVGQVAHVVQLLALLRLPPVEHDQERLGALVVLHLSVELIQSALRVPDAPACAEHLQFYQVVLAEEVHEEVHESVPVRDFSPHERQPRPVSVQEQA